MKTATVTYVAPLGDSKVVEMGGLTFFDGKSQEINDHDNPHLFSKLQGNPYFDFAMGKDQPDTVKPPVKRGRPSNVDKAAARAEAEETERLAKEAAEKAKEAKAVHEAITKEEKPVEKPAVKAAITPQPDPKPAPTPLPTPSPAV